MDPQPRGVTKPSGALYVALASDNGYAFIILWQLTFNLLFVSAFVTLCLRTLVIVVVDEPPWLNKFVYLIRLNSNRLL